MSYISSSSSSSLSSSLISSTEHNIFSTGVCANDTRIRCINDYNIYTFNEQLNVIIDTFHCTIDKVKGKYEICRGLSFGNNSISFIINIYVNVDKCVFNETLYEYIHTYNKHLLFVLQ